MTAAWILGRGGLLGSSLSRALREHSIEECVPKTPIVWNNDATLQQQINQYIHEFEERVRHADEWHVYWAAGTGTMASTEEEMLREKNLLSIVLKALHESPILTQKTGLIIFASSAGAVYAGCTDNIFTERSTPCPLNAYGRGKLEQEALFTRFAADHPAPSVFIARISNLYGAGQSLSKKQGLLSHIARSILRRTPINIFVPFDTIRDYVTADDAAACILEVIRRRDVRKKMTMKIIASESPTTIAQIIGSFKVITRVAPRIITSTSPLRDAYTHRMCFRSVAEPKIQRPTTSLLVGIAHVMAAERRAMMRR